VPFPLPLSQHLGVADGSFTGVSGIACGGWHSCALTTTGDVYVWGWNKHGQLGARQVKVTLSPLPRLLPEVDGQVIKVR